MRKPALTNSSLAISVLTIRSDHFDAEVESSLRRDLPIITTPHAKSHLTSSKEGGQEEAFTSVYDLDFFEEMGVDIKGTVSLSLSSISWPRSSIPCPWRLNAVGKL